MAVSSLNEHTERWRTHQQPRRVDYHRDGFVRPPDPCICPDDFCLGTDSDSGMRVECAACLALDPEMPCIADPEETP